MHYKYVYEFGSGRRQFFFHMQKGTVDVSFTLVALEKKFWVASNMNVPFVENSSSTS